MPPPNLHGRKDIHIHVHDKHTDTLYKSNPIDVTFPKKIVALCRLETHNLQHSRLNLYQLSYQGSSAGCVQFLPYKYISQPDYQVLKAITNTCVGQDKGSIFSTLANQHMQLVPMTSRKNVTLRKH